jgi:NADH-quinone oxidoreductase subunit L
MVTAVYTFRALFMTFHGKPRMDDHTWSHVHESPWVVWLPLVLLAIPSVILGYIMYMPMLFDTPTLLNSSIFVLPAHNVLAEMAKEVVSPLKTMLTAFDSLVFWMTLAGIGIAWVCYIAIPSIPAYLAKKFAWIYQILVDKYGFDSFYDFAFVRGAKALGQGFYNIGDQKLIDGLIVNGTGHTVKWFAVKGKSIQSGYLYHYVAVMVLGIVGFLCWLLLG